ncbi:MAG: hypothetical protein CMF31_05180 [Kordiimonas sp.]|nr:hypothetical protein [Kordiimonas sp.]|tara:strand:+ start:3473 stop:3763 length:291 start_codon:yes stop_codon:yes gene_type:complete
MKILAAIMIKTIDKMFLISVIFAGMFSSYPFIHSLCLTSVPVAVWVMAWLIIRQTETRRLTVAQITKITGTFAFKIQTLFWLSHLLTSAFKSTVML